MKTLSILCLSWFAISLGPRADAQIYDTNNVVVQTFVGSGFSGYLDGQGTQTMFNNPMKVVADSSSNLFVLDFGNSRIRKVAPDGTVSTFAGGGTGPLPGSGTTVSLGLTYYSSMAIDHSNTLWISTSSGLLRIGSDAYASRTTLTGLTFTSGVGVDSGNNIYYTAPDANQIYRWRTNRVLEVFAGSGNQGSADGNGVFTSFHYPTTLAADMADNIYIWDSGNYLIRRISQSKDVVTIAGKNGVQSLDSDGEGTNATFSSVSAMCVDSSGDIILACYGSVGSSIRKMTAATNVTTLAGSFTQTGYTSGVGWLARFFGSSGVCISQGMIFVADCNNQRIRNISFNPAPQIVSGGNLDLSTYAGLKITGVVGRTYRIESSTDMTGWNTETTVLLTGSPYLWIDPSALGQNKFYRAFLLP